jgi:uncharacterized protein YrrD
MFTGESLIGRRVLARQEGQMLDSVKDVVIDTAERRVVALLISEGRLFSSPTVIPLEKVASIGDDAIVVVDAASAVPVDQYPMVKEILDRDDRLVGKEVYTEAGSAFGKVVDVSFELPLGNITELKVASRSGDDKPVTNVGVPVSDVISIGPHAAVIRQIADPRTTVGMAAAADQGPAITDAPPTSLLAEETETPGGWSARTAAAGPVPPLDPDKQDDGAGSSTI